MGASERLHIFFLSLKQYKYNVLCCGMKNENIANWAKRYIFVLLLQVTTSNKMLKSEPCSHRHQYYPLTFTGQATAQPMGALRNI